MGEGQDTFTGPLRIVWVVAHLSGEKLIKLSKKTVVEYTKVTNLKVLGE